MGKQKGKGREFDSCTKYFLYDGEYLNGEKNGKGKEYDNSGFLVFVFPFKYSPSKIISPYILYSLPFPFLFLFKYSPSNNNLS